MIKPIRVICNGSCLPTTPLCLASCPVPIFPDAWPWPCLPRQLLSPPAGFCKTFVCNKLFQATHAQTQRPLATVASSGPIPKKETGGQTFRPALGPVGHQCLARDLAIGRALLLRLPCAVCSRPLRTLSMVPLTSACLPGSSRPHARAIADLPARSAAVVLVVLHVVLLQHLPTLRIHTASPPPRSDSSDPRVRLFFPPTRTFFRLSVHHLPARPARRLAVQCSTQARVPMHARFWHT